LKYSGQMTGHSWQQSIPHGPEFKASRGLLTPCSEGIFMGYIWLEGGAEPGTDVF